MSSEVNRRTRKKLQARDRIVNCAALLFASRGYLDTTMEEIGNCAGVSRATVFNYFPRKEDLVLAWFDSRRADLTSVFADTTGKSEETWALLRRAFSTIAQLFESNAQTSRGMVRGWLHAGGPLLTPDSDTARLFAGAIRTGQTIGDVAPDIDPVRVGRVLFDAYSGVLYRWVFAADDEISLEEELLATLDVVLGAIVNPA